MNSVDKITIVRQFVGIKCNSFFYSRNRIVLSRQKLCTFSAKYTYNISIVRQRKYSCLHTNEKKTEVGTYVLFRIPLLTFYDIIR